MKTVLVTGGAGYIGSVLVRHLLQLDYKIKVLDRCFFGIDSIKSLLNNPNFELIKDDIRFFDPKILKDVDAVIDLAGLSNDPSCDLDPELTMDINYRGCVRVARLSKEMGVKKYIFSSSCSVYGFGRTLGLTEESPTNPVSLYAQTKLMVEEEVLELADKDFCVTCLRNATVYGLSPKMRFDLVINVMTLYAFEKGKIYILGTGKQWRPVVHINDVCTAFETVLKADTSIVNGQIFNVGSNEQNYQILQLGMIVKNVLPNIELEVIPDDPDRRNYNVNFDKISKELGFKVTKKPVDGIKEIYSALMSGKIMKDTRAFTLDYYKFLIKAEKVLKEVLLRGRLF